MGGQVQPMVVPASISVFPVVRMSAQMHHCKYEYPTLFDTVKHAKRETVYKTAPNIFFYNRPGIRIIYDILYSGKDLGRKVIA